MSRRTAMLFAVEVTLVMAVTPACLSRELSPIAPCVQSGVSLTLSQDAVDQVDVLFMVDNSSSMHQEQDNLAEDFPVLVRILATGDSDQDGVRDFPPVRDLHVGVVSSDMGTYGVGVDGCSDASDPDGDDGILITRGQTADPGCAAQYPSFLGFMPDQNDAASFAQQFSCVARLGEDGCGFEQQLEAVLKAVTPSTSPITFFSGTGHADIENAGFFRPNAVLAIVMVTDEDDCSAADPEVYDTRSTRLPESNGNIRCFTYGSETAGVLHPLSRYVDGFLDAVGNNPNRLVFAAITGIPIEVPSTDGGGDAVDFDGILSHPRMQEHLDPATLNRLATSCDVAGLGTAYPPRRIVEVARQIDERTEGNASVHSICRDDLGPALQRITAKIGNLLQGACLPRELDVSPDGTVNCTVREIVAAGCAAAPGAPPCTTPAELANCPTDAAGCCLGLDAVTREPLGQLCTIPQVRAGGASAGWRYEPNGDPDRCRAGTGPQRITFSESFIPPPGAIVRLECLQPVLGQRTCTADSECGPGEACVSGHCGSPNCGE